jgi:hypothetical protein
MVLFSRFERLVKKAEKLGESFPIMPVDEIRLATAFTELPNRSSVVARLISELFDHPNMHVRRIAINACRRSKEFGVPGLEEAVTAKLGDSEPWVRYDAAWAALDAAYDSSTIRAALAAAAGAAPLQELQVAVEKDPGNPELRARLRAHEALHALSLQAAG